ncbi:MAG: undecaprenyl diphosphate synthase family protein [Xanthobacteraceae bacterium]
MRTEIARLVETRTRAAEGRTASGEALHLRVALDYSARDAVLRAVAACEPGVELTRETLGRLISGEYDAEHRDVDLLIRSGGEKQKRKPSSGSMLSQPIGENGQRSWPRPN